MTDKARNAASILVEAVESFKAVVSLADVVDAAAAAATTALYQGKKLFFCGNGGSAADAQHLAAEFLGKFLLERAPWPAICLSTNSSAVTAIGNDYGYEQTFARQLRGLGASGDVIFGISTSGKSKNVIEAFRTARELNMLLISLTGRSPSPMSELADIAISVPSVHTPRIQEMHIAVGHAICELTEIALVRAQE